MKSIRIGNDIRIEWPIVLSGDVEKLKDLDLTVEVRPSAKTIDTHNYVDAPKAKEIKVMMNGGMSCRPDIGDGKERCRPRPCQPQPHKLMPPAPVRLPYHIEDNTLIAMWTADRQFATGDYDIILYAHKNEGGQAVCDQYRFVRLVSHTAEADNPDDSGIEAVIAMQPVTLKLSGLSAYEVAVVNGFQGTEEEWLQSLKQPAIDAAEQAKEDIEKYKTETKAELKADIEALGYYEDNPEYMRVYNDAEGKFLWGIRVDGSIEWAKGVPAPIKEALKRNAEYIKQNANDIDNLEKEVWPLKVTFTANPTILEYTGTAQKIELNWNVKRRGENITADNITVNISDIQAYSGKDNPGSVNGEVNTNGTTRCELTITAEGMTATTAINIQQAGAMYFGFNAADTATSLTITELTKQTIKTSPVGTYTLNNATTGHYMWLCVPSNMTIKRVTLNGFDVPMETAQTKQQGALQYKCYRSSNALVAQDYTIAIS